MSSLKDFMILADHNFCCKIFDEAYRDRDEILASLNKDSGQKTYCYVK